MMPACRETVFSIGGHVPSIITRLREAGVTYIVDLRPESDSTLALKDDAERNGMSYHRSFYLSSRYIGRRRVEIRQAQEWLERRLAEPERIDALRELRELRKLINTKGTTVALVGHQRQHARCHRANVCNRLNVSPMPLCELVRKKNEGQRLLFG